MFCHRCLKAESPIGLPQRVSVYSGWFRNLPKWYLWHMSDLPEKLREQVEKAKGFYDLCSPTLTQLIAERYYSLPLDDLLEKELAVYRERGRAMIEAVGQYFPDGIMTKPTGGFFVWWESLPGVDFDAKHFNEAVAIPNQLLFVPSQAFYPPIGWIVDDAGKLKSFKPRRNGMRLSFSAVPAERIWEGIETLGALLKQTLS